MKNKGCLIGCLAGVVIALIIVALLIVGAVSLFDGLGDFFDDDDYGYYDDDYDDDDYEIGGWGGGSLSSGGSFWDDLLADDEEDEDDYWEYDDYDFSDFWGDHTSSWGGHSSYTYETEPVPAETYSVSESTTGARSATVMIYMVGSNLESDDGSATDDLKEMAKAQFGDNINLVIQTGGTKKWKTSAISNGKVQRFTMEGGSLHLQQDLGKNRMLTVSALTDFVAWSAKNYPADRYGLIFWDHGGGTMVGFGSDEIYPNDVLTISDIHSALSQTGVHFDFVGFDACLMGTVETAFAVADFADYLIAAEETEPGQGWYYTEWLKLLSADPGTNTEVLGKRIVDDFVSKAGRFEETTLSVIRLSQIQNVYSALSGYLSECGDVLASSGYSKVSSARNNAKSFGEDEYEQIDILSYVNCAGPMNSADAVRSAVRSAVVYTNGTVSDANGLAMYYPYNQLDYYSDVMGMLSQMGYNNRGYVSYFDTFVNDIAYGQYYSWGHNRSMSPAEQLTGYTQQAQDYSDAYWFDADNANDLDPSAMLTADGTLPLTEKNGGYVLHLSEEQWDSIAYAEMSLYIDDGEGYLDFGTDTAIDYDRDGDLVADFDFCWLSLDEEQIVPFFTLEDEVDSQGRWHALGYVPATLNDGEDIEILCYWDDDHLGGVIKGYRFAEDGGMYQRNLLQLKAGDKLDFYCDYYTYDGEYDAAYYVGDPITVGPDGLKLCYLYMADGEHALVSFHLRDLYRNDYWTEALDMVNG